MSFSIFLALESNFTSNPVSNSALDSVSNPISNSVSNSASNSASNSVSGSVSSPLKFKSIPSFERMYVSRLVSVFKSRLWSYKFKFQ